MGKRRENKAPRGTRRAGRILSITGTVLIVLVIILCSFLVLPGIFSYQMFHVISGSMEPAVKVGSLIYVHEEKPEGIKEKDIIAFYGMPDGGIITHRVVANNVVSGTFVTKGDANAGEDPVPVSYDNFIGKVKLTVPYMGKVLTVMTSFHGKIAAACVVGLGAVLNLIGGRSKKESKNTCQNRNEKQNNEK